MSFYPPEKALFYPSFSKVFFFFKISSVICLWASGYCLAEERNYRQVRSGTLEQQQHCRSCRIFRNIEKCNLSLYLRRKVPPFFFLVVFCMIQTPMFLFKEKYPDPKFWSIKEGTFYGIIVISSSSFFLDSF